MAFRTSAVAVCCCRDSAEFAGSRLYLFEQPNVLDRDDGLVGEGLKQLDVTSAKEPG